MTKEQRDAKVKGACESLDEALRCPAAKGRLRKAGPKTAKLIDPGKRE